MGRLKTFPRPQVENPRYGRLENLRYGGGAEMHSDATGSSTGAPS